MNRELRNAIRNFEIEVDREAARLIEHGVDPHDAIGRARKTVLLRRAERANIREMDKVQHET